MALAVCALFDHRSQRRIRDLWDRLEAQGVRTLATHTHGRHHPHLSYAVLRAWDLDRVRTALAAFPDAGPFPVACHGTLAFPRGRAALAASVTADVAARQERVVAALLGTGADLHRNYARGNWVPHVSVATGAPGAQLAGVVEAISAVLPLRLEVVAAALVDSATGQTWRLDRIP